MADSLPPHSIGIIPHLSNVHMRHVCVNPIIKTSIVSTDNLPTFIFQALPPLSATSKHISNLNQ